MNTLLELVPRDAGALTAEPKVEFRAEVDAHFGERCPYTAACTNTTRVCYETA